MCAKKATAKKSATTKAAKAKKRKPTKNELLAEKAQLFDRIRAKEKERRKLLSRFEQLSRERKSAKEALGFCESEICGLGHALDEKHPLFDQSATPESPKQDAEKKVDSIGSSPADKDDWKTLPISSLNLPEKVASAITDAGHSTLGALQSHMNDQGLWWGKQIKGLGEKGQDAVLDAFASFWSEHPEYCEDKQQAA